MVSKAVHITHNLLTKHSSSAIKLQMFSTENKSFGNLPIQYLHFTQLCFIKIIIHINNSWAQDDQSTQI